MPRYFMMAIMMLIWVGIAGCNGHTKESLNTDGQDLLRRGNPNGAIILFKNALEKDPNFLEARFNLGLAYVETGKFDQAEREFQKVQLQNPQDAKVKFELARIANFQNKPAVAIPLLDAYLSEHPDNADALEQLAIAATISGDPAAARKHLEKVLALEPGRTSAQLALIQNFMTQGDLARARETINALLAKDSKNHQALYALAQLEAREADPEGLLDAFSQITSTYPDDLYARYKAGSLLIDKGQGDAVKASAEAMIKDFPEKAEGYRLLGLYFLHTGSHKEAITALSKSLRIQADLETAYLLGLAHYFSGNLEMAVTEFQAVLDNSPDFIQARIVLGEIFIRQRRGNEAALVADKIMETHPEDFRGQALKADALALMGRSNEALKYYAQAVSLAPGHYDLLLKGGLLKLAVGNADGEQDIQAALRISPRSNEARLALHAYYLRLGRIDEATRVLKEGLGGVKSDAVLFNALAKLALGRRDIADAEECLVKARAADPSLLQTYQNTAAFRLAQGRVDDAVAEYDLALGVKPGDVRTLMLSAAVLEKQGKVEEALARLEKARATGDMDAAVALAAFLQGHGKSDAALNVLDEALEKNPTNFRLMQLKAQLHIVRKETDKAMTLYSQIEAADPGVGVMGRMRAWVALGDLDKAEECARRLIQLKSDNAQSYLPLASILEVRNDRPGAERELLKSAGIEPGNAQIKVLLGELRLRARELDTAMQAFDAALAVEPTNPQALTGKGMVMQYQGDRDGAARFYMQAVQTKHDHVQALNNLAMLWADDEKTRAKAVDLALFAFFRAESSPSVIDTLGYTLIKNDRAQEALKILERALALSSGNPVIMYHRAMALEKLGRGEEARAALSAALAGGEFAERPEAMTMMARLKVE